jgi:hypothetical protein
MHDAIRNQLGAVVMPADRVGGGVDRGRGKLFQAEDGHGTRTSTTLDGS